jgi:peroxiredoxin
MPARDIPISGDVMNPRNCGLALLLAFAWGAVSVGAWAAEEAAAAAPPAMGQKAPDFTLQAPGGQAVELSKELAERPVVLVVLRGWPGYQCPFCTRQVGEFVARSADLERAGVRVILVYPGPAEKLKEHAEEFAQGKGLPAGFRFVMDPDYTFTNRYGLRWDKKGETAYPSTFVIDRDGTVRFAKVSKSHGDRASAEEVLKALAK